MSPRAPVTLVISDLIVGGTQAAVSRLANALSGEGRAVTLLALDSPHRPPFHPLAPEVRVVRLDAARNSRGIVSAIKRNISILMLLRRALRSQPAGSAFISFGDRTNIRVLLASRGTGLRVIASERTTPWLPPPAWPWKFLRRLTYPGARAVVVLNERCAAYFRPWLGEKVRVIPNMVEAVPPADPLALRALEILGVGRLEPVKGFDLLIRAFARVRDELPGWRLVLQGEGSARGELEKLAADLHLGESVSLPGVARSPREAMRRASIFVLSSRVEAFPNALCEAMASGLAVIAFDCPTGPREIVTQDLDGLLVPPGDVGALAEALVRLARDSREREALGARATRIAQRYPPSGILARWSALIDRTNAS
jgi:GalNAc-alpha-(1->4)-GalNAc-alpha-(1->3)-diNAcBac-PP-undecaprenol alpha-1,4-N-acetyl-D-galactosaminyltransferase